jgi:hypothetical protein
MEFVARKASVQGSVRAQLSRDDSRHVVVETANAVGAGLEIGLDHLVDVVEADAGRGTRSAVRRSVSALCMTIAKVRIHPHPQQVPPR